MRYYPNLSRQLSGMTVTIVTVHEDTKDYARVHDWPRGVHLTQPNCNNTSCLVSSISILLLQDYIDSDTMIVSVPVHQCDIPLSRSLRVEQGNMHGNSNHWLKPRTTETDYWWSWREKSMWAMRIPDCLRSVAFVFIVLHMKGELNWMITAIATKLFAS